MNNCIVKVFLILTTFVCFSKANAQITISYPVPAQKITRSLDSSLLTVEIGFTGSCTATQVTIALPASVIYIAGSVVKTNGHGPAITIAESDISNLSAPIFSLSNVTAPGDITFTIKRQADCGALISGKDTVKVTGGCGTAIENVAGVNTYSLLTPTLSIVPPATITNAFLNTPYTRTTSVTNGGNGCTDTLRYYMVYPGGGIKLQDAPTNTVLANGISFTPWKINGDTLFYKIFGATIFGGDNLLCNGDTVHIVENIKLLQCNASTKYAAFWGKSPVVGCQTAVGTGTTSMATGAAIPSASFTIVQDRSECRPGIYKITYKNTGSGGNAGAMYNVVPLLGFGGNPVLYAAGNGNLGGIFYDSVKLGASPANLILTGTYPQFTVNMNQFTSDPDGAGIGLDDLDGDGQYDDLPPGQSIVFTVYDHYLCSSTCPFPSHSLSDNTILNYNTICGGATVTTGILLSGIGGVQKSITPTLPITGPAQVQGGTPFTLSSCTGGFIPAGYHPYDTAYMMYILPAGVTYSGNATLNGIAIAPGKVYTHPGILGAPDTLFLTAKGANERSCWSADLLYSCGGSTTLNISMMNRYIGDNSCTCGVQNLQCGSTSLSAICPGGTCASGFSNYQPVAKRTTLGWTNNTLTTKVAAVAGIPSYTVLPYDTLNIHATAIENTTFNNGSYVLQFGKATGKNVFNVLAGAKFNVKDHLTGIVTSCTLPVPADSSTATLQKYYFDFSSCLPAATITTGDSVWIDVPVVTTAVNNYLLYGVGLQGVPNTQSYFFNRDAGGVQNYCVPWPINLYANGIVYSQNGSGNTIALACNNSSLSSSEVLNDNNGYDVFPTELRPDFSMDSIIVTLPNGYVYNPGVTPVWKNGFWTSTFVSSNGSTTVTPVISGNTVSFYKTSSTLLPSDIMINGNSTANNLVLGIIPTCAAPITASNATIKYYAKMFAYIPAVERDTIITITSPTYTYPTINRAAINIQNNSGVVQGVKPQQFWDVQIGNSSTQTAPYIWLGLEKITGTGITIDSVVLKPSNVVMAPLAYGASNSWYQVSAAGLTPGSNQVARVYFKYSNCVLDSILAKAGYNCVGYPTDPTAYACTPVQTYLTVDPQVSQMQVNVTRQPGNGSPIPLCSTDSILIQVNSAQAGYLVGPYVNVYPPTGVTPVLPIQIEYPSGSGNYQNAAVTPIAGGYKIDLTAHTGIGVNGIPGTITNPAIAGRQAKIIIKYTTDCSVVSGSTLSISGFGSEPCGVATIGNGGGQQSGGVNIAGAAVTGSASLSLALGSPVLSCGQPTTLSLSFTPVVAPSQAGDTAIYTLPAGLTYAGNFVQGANCSLCTISTNPRASGTTIVRVALQTGVASGSSLDYSFDVSTTVTGFVKSPIQGAAQRNTPAVTCGATTCAGKAVIIATGASDSLSLDLTTLATPAVSIAASSGANICAGSLVTFTATPTNGGTSPSYQWMLNNTPVGIDSSKYTDTIPKAADSIYVILTSNQNCLTAATAMSNVLKVKDTSFSIKFDTVCSNMLPYFWNGRTYTATAADSIKLTNSVGCDSLARLFLFVKDTSFSITRDTVCSNTLPFFWNAKSYTANSSDSMMFTNAAGCDSLARFFLVVNDTTFSVEKDTVCSNMLPFTWHSKSYTVSSLDSIMLSTVAGCDSLAKLILTVKDTSFSITRDTVCSNMLPFIWNAKNYTASSADSIMFTNAAGCDSLARFFLVVNDTSFSIEKDTVCSNMLPFIWNTRSYTTTKNDSIMLHTVAGCDSLAKLFLVVKDTSFSVHRDTVCSNRLPYVWNTRNYTASTIDSIMLRTVAGCDSLAKLILTVRDTSKSNTPVSVCPAQLPYHWNGNNYSAAGNYSVPFINTVGCDSIAVLNLSVYPLPEVDISTLDSNILLGNTATIVATITGTYSSILWTSPSGFTDNSTTIVVSPTSSTTYTIDVVSGSNDCSVDKTIAVSVYAPFHMPNAFTPNGDGLNGLFRIPPGMYIKLKNFAIYDRWGLKVFETDKITDGWNGEYDGVPQPMGGYVYVITGDDITGKSVVYKNSLLLIR
jgi:gliding motility-associated-like protein